MTLTLHSQVSVGINTVDTLRMRQAQQSDLLEKLSHNGVKVIRVGLATDIQDCLLRSRGLRRCRPDHPKEAPAYYVVTDCMESHTGDPMQSKNQVNRNLMLI